MRKDGHRDCRGSTCHQLICILGSERWGKANPAASCWSCQPWRTVICTAALWESSVLALKYIETGCILPFYHLCDPPFLLKLLLLSKQAAHRNQAPEKQIKTLFASEFTANRCQNTATAWKVWGTPSTQFPFSCTEPVNPIGDKSGLWIVLHLHHLLFNFNGGGGGPVLLLLDWLFHFCV